VLLRAGAEHATAWAYRAGWWAVRGAPEPVVAAALRQVADRTWRRRGRGVVQLERNLARARPEAGPDELRELSHAAMRSYLRYWGEVFRLPRWTPDVLRDRVVTHDAHRMVDPLSEGQGVVAALPHMGNWDLAGAWACAEGMPVTTVAERLRPESLYRDFLRYRESLGMTVLPLTGGPPTLPVLEARVRAGGLVPLMADRDLSRSAVTVELLGAPARLPVGPALLAQRTGARLLPVTASYDSDARMHLWFHEPVPVGPGSDSGSDSGSDDVRTATAAVADAFSAAIRRDPADWHMLQRVFVDDLS
jgi:lauroyl/myristoyl acyltransferase